MRLTRSPPPISPTVLAHQSHLPSLRRGYAEHTFAAIDKLPSPVSDLAREYSALHLQKAAHVATAQSWVRKSMRASILLLRPAKDKVEILVEAFNGDHLIPGVVVTDKNTNYRQQLRSGLQQRYGSTSLLEMLDKARKLRPHSKAMQSVYYIAIAQPSFAVETKKAALGFVELTPSLSKAIDCAESADVVFTVWQELCAHKPAKNLRLGVLKQAKQQLETIMASRAPILTSTSKRQG